MRQGRTQIRRGWCKIFTMVKSAPGPIDEYYSACLKGELTVGIRALGRAASKRGAPKTVQSLDQKVRMRFGREDENHRISTDDPFVWQLVRSYRAYYRRSLLRGGVDLPAERELAGRLERLADSVGIARREMKTNDKIECALARELSKRGYHSLFGTVLPFRNLMIWRSQKVRRYVVPLVEGSQPVKVILLGEFVEFDWLHFATFGRHAVGGWAKPTALYCVATRYDLRSETYRLSYLHHEAQHFADYRTFPKLKQSGLEYRAKLAELAVLSRPMKLIEHLRQQAKKDPTQPHPFAAYRILRDLGAMTPPPHTRSEMQAAARELIRKDSSSLRRRNAIRKKRSERK